MDTAAPTIVRGNLLLPGIEVAHRSAAVVKEEVKARQCRISHATCVPAQNASANTSVSNAVRSAGSTAKKDRLREAQ